MTLAEEFEILKREAQNAELLQTDVFYRRDGKPSMKTRVKFVEGERQEVQEDKPIKSVHMIYFTPDLFLRLKKSNYERKAHLPMLEDIIKKFNLTQLRHIFNTMSGIERGKNIYWNAVTENETATYVSVQAYLKKCKEDEKKVYETPVVGDDQVLVAGWKL